jgi:uncharacterized protein YcfJ
VRLIFKALAVAFVLYVGMSTSYADCVCMRWTLETPEVRGRVMATDRQKPKEETPIVGAVVRLLKCEQIAGTPCRIIATSTSDEGGRFMIEGVDAGKYMLDVGAARFQPLTIGTQVTGRSKGKKEIVISLESERRCCAGRAEMRKVKSK